MPLADDISLPPGYKCGQRVMSGDTNACIEIRRLS